MNQDRKLGKGVILGVLSTGIDSFVALATAPLLLSQLGREVTGVWMMFVSMATLLMALQMGMGPTLTRRVAALPKEKDGRPESGAWMELVGVAGRLYLVICALLAAGAVLLWFTYLRGSAVAVGGDFLAWTAFATGVGVRLFSQYHFSVLNGLGYVGIDKITNTAGGVLNLALVFELTPVWRSLAAPVCAYLISGIGILIASQFLVRRLGQTGASPAWRKNIVAGLLGEGAKMFVLNVTGYVTSQGCLVVMESMRGPAAVGVFSPVLRAVFLLVSLSSLVVNMSYPYMASAWAVGDLKSVRRLAGRSMLLAVGGYSLVVAPLVFAPEWVITLWLGPENYIGDAATRLTAAYGLLYVGHMAAATPVLAGQKADFVLVAIVNMVLVAVAMVWWAKRASGFAVFPAGMLLGTIGPSLTVFVISWRVLRLRPAVLP
jgi:O-antigen/teichoic acid export membrane protein